MLFRDLEKFYRGKKVFITGHTGFKGAWLCMVLNMLGADVYGYSLEPPTTPNAYELMGGDKFTHSYIGDIRNFDYLRSVMKKVNPDVVFHLAAQPIVRESYRIPRETYEINVMGTVNVLEAVRTCCNAVSILNVTTDKVYENSDIADHAFKEEEKLDGFDPYSNSKSCSEIITHAYKKSFFENNNLQAISTARAGNVIGGGDFAKDRIIPDCVKAAVNNDAILIRNPYSTRPYQHVLEPLSAYLVIGMMQAADIKLADYYNVGPDEVDCVTTGVLADLFVKNWGVGVRWIDQSDRNALHEANYLKLDCTKIKTKLGWRAVWHVEEAVENTVAWYKAWNHKEDMVEFTEKQIKEFFK